MEDAAPKAIAISSAIDQLIREDRGRLLSALIARLGSFQLAEDALQEAAISALGHWGRSGIPDSPLGWLLKVALRKGIDIIRKDNREVDKVAELEKVTDSGSPNTASELIPDERLRLIFACCHPALEEKSRIALTLRVVCNLTTKEIASAFLDNEPTMGQRLSRAKAKIKAKGIGFRVPDKDQWDDRLETVLSTIYLIFTTGYVMEDTGDRDLCNEAIFLIELMLRLKPEEPEIEGALALMKFVHARESARKNINGAMVPIEEQDRSLWDDALVLQARQLLNSALKRKKIGPYQIKAAIADCHMEDPAPDWKQMDLLYAELWHYEPTPIVALNWAVVIAETGRMEDALKRIDGLEAELTKYQPWHASRAYVLQKLGNIDDAIEAYKEAISLAPNQASRHYLQQKLESLVAG